MAQHDDVLVNPGGAIAPVSNERPVYKPCGNTLADSVLSERKKRRHFLGSLLLAPMSSDFTTEAK